MIQPGHWSHCRIHFLRCLLSDGLRGEGLGIPSALLGCHQVRGAHLAPVMDVSVILQLKFLHSYENVEVPEFPFLDRVLQLPVVLQRRLRAVQTVQKLELPPCSSSTLFTCPLLCVDRCRRWSRQCRKTVKIPHTFWDMVVLPVVVTMTGAGWLIQCRKLWSLRSWFCNSLSLSTAVTAAAMVFQMSWTTNNSGDGDLAASSFSVSCVQGSVAQGFEPRSARAIILRASYEVWAAYGAVLTPRSRRVRFQDLASWTRMLTCPCWPRHGVVAVLQLQFIDWWSAHLGYGELMRLLFRAVYTGTRPRFDPRHQSGEGVAGDAGSLLPGVLPPN